MKHKIIGYVVALVLLIAGFTIMQKMIAGKKAPERKAVNQSAKLVNVIDAKLVDTKVKIQINGKLEALNRIELYSEIGGRFLNTRKPFKEGIVYKKGEVIIALDNSDAKAALIAQKSSFLTLLTQIIADIKFDYPDNYDAWNNYIQNFNIEKAIPGLPNTKSNQEKNFVIAKNIFNSYYNIKSQEVKVSKYRIIAPYSGVLSLTTTQEGSIIRPGQKLGEFIQSGSLELEAPINVKDISYLKLNQEVELQSNDIAGSWKGRISRIGKVIDSKTQSVSVYISVNSKELKEGMYLNGFINSNIIPASIEIPRKLLSEQQTIYVVIDDKLKIIKPKVEKLNESTIIISGIEEGTQLLSESFVGLYEGMNVKIANK